MNKFGSIFSQSRSHRGVGLAMQHFWPMKIGNSCLIIFFVPSIPHCGILIVIFHTDVFDRA